jgi:predicted Zn finger-like uncharacterized protein
MQFGCESCKAQLQIADEKVRGKRLIVRCRRCGAKIALADPALSNSSPRLVVAPASAPGPMRIVPRPAPDPERPASDDESTRAMDSDLLERALRASKADEARQNGAAPLTQKLHFPGPVVPLDGPIWYAMLRGKQTGPVTREDLEERANDGELGPRTYLWREGMDAWQHAKDIPELWDLFPQLPEAVRPGVAPAPRPVPAQASAAQPTPEQPASVKGEPTPAANPNPAGDPGHAGEASGERTAEKSALDLAPGATSEIAQGQEPGSAPGDAQKMAAPVLQRSAPLFESASPPARGPFVVFLGLIGLAAAAIVLWITLASSPSKEEGKPEAQSQRLDPAPAPQPARGTPKPGDPVPEEAKPAEAPGVAVSVLTAEQVHRKLDENKPALQGCVDDALRRDPHLKVGKIHVATTIAPTGEVTAARIDQRSVDESALGACLKLATKKIVFPQFAGAAFDVDIPIVVTAGESN